MKFFIQLTLLLSFFSISGLSAQTIPDYFKPFSKIVGKTYRGTFLDSSGQKSAVDIARWEWALNGQAIRVLHSVNNGQYGGETIVYFDKKTQEIRYFYFTTTGFYTQGTMRWEGDKLISHEKVEGNEKGITEVKSVAELLPDGGWKGAAHYLQNGKWVPGHQIIYRIDPQARVVFKNPQ